MSTVVHLSKNLLQGERISFIEFHEFCSHSNFVVSAFDNNFRLRLYWQAEAPANH